MQFHIEIDEEKVGVWVKDDDENWARTREIYESVQDRNTMLENIPRYIDKHKSTADHIYTKWLETTEWHSLLKNR